MKYVLLLLMFSAPLLAQVNNPPIISVASAPSGTCPGGLPNQQVVSTGIQYSCQNGTWAAFSTGGGGSFTAGGDLSGSNTSQTVIGINGTLLSGLATGALKMTAGVPSTVPINGAGAGLVTGPASAPSADIPVFTGTAGAIVDSGITITSLAPLASPTFTGTVTIPTGASLGTPASGVITNLTGTCASCIASNVSATTNATITTLSSLSLPNTQVTGLGTASTANTGSSGATVPFLNGTNTWGGAQTFQAATTTFGVPGSTTGILKLGSATATGSVSITPASAASAFTATLPAATDTIAELAATQTFTNKTLTSPTISGGGTINSATVGQTTPAAGSFTALKGTTLLTTTNCAAVGTSASPSLVACAAAASGSFSCAVTASAATCTVSTTAVTASSVILVEENSAVGTKLSVTCNTTPSAAPIITLASLSAGASFTINVPTITTNPACFNYVIYN